MVHGPGPQDWSMDLGSMFCMRPSKGDFLHTWICHAELHFCSICKIKTGSSLNMHEIILKLFTQEMMHVQ